VEWEFAARGGLDGAAFVWGDEPRPGGRLTPIVHEMTEAERDRVVLGL
jgi:formylglycine-generating enzyme required for sulfatase activity